MNPDPFASGAQKQSLRFVLAGSAVFIGLFIVFSVRYARMIDWNGIRISPMFALLHGTPLYSPRNGGVITGNIYPPLATLAYIPCALLSNPSNIMELGSLLACVFYFLAFIVLACLAVRRWEVPAIDAGLVLVAAALLTAFDPPLRYTALMAHADAPGFALAGLALCLVLFGVNDGRFAWSTAAGALAAAAVLAKQSFIGVWFALFLWLIRRSWRVAACFATGATVVTAVFCTILLLSGNWHNFLFNCIYIPSHHPWDLHAFLLGGDGGGGIIVQRLQAVVESFLDIAPTWYLWIAVGGWILWRSSSAPPASPISRLNAPVWVFVAQLPLSLMAHKKIGGDVNTLGDSLYFLLFAVCALALVTAANRAWSAGRRAALTILIGVLIICNTPRFLFLVHNSSRPDPNAPMMEFLRKHPNQVYLPWNPLLTGLSDGIDYHFEYGVFDRALAGVPLAANVYRSHLPSKMRFVAVRRSQPDSSHGTFSSLLPELQESRAPPGLEEWRFYAFTPAH
jgi:hypothetical protein